MGRSHELGMTELSVNNRTVEQGFHVQSIVKLAQAVATKIP